jgi:hypothetical protein
VACKLGADLPQRAGAAATGSDGRSIPGRPGRKQRYDRDVGIDPDLGAVLLAVAAGVGLTLAGRGRRVCDSCGRRVKSVLCACQQEVSEAVDTVEERVAKARRK